MALLFIAFILSIDTLAKSIAEKRLSAQTGMKAHIGKFSIGLSSPTIHIQNFVLKNPAEFGGDSFLEMPELYLDYDREALRSGKLHLNRVRIDIAKIHLIENKDGKKNLDGLQKRQAKSKSSSGSARRSERAFAFDGIDLLDVSLNSVQFTSEKHPDQNLQQDFAIEHEMFKNLKTDLDFQTAAAVLLLKACLSGVLDLDTFFKTSRKAGKKTKKVLEELPKPLELISTNLNWTNSISTNF